MYTDNDPLNFPQKSSENTGHGLATVLVPKQLTLANSLEEILAFARRENASDVHLCPANPVVFRKNGRLLNMTNEILTDRHIRYLLIKCLPTRIMEAFDASGDMEYVHTITGYGRFRLTLMKQRFGWEATIRLIALEIPRFAATGMPTPCANLIKWNQGIILITGPAGSGKTTNMSALVEMINQRRYEHIITLEQPIEVLYEPELCQISQREIFTHTTSQDTALRAALREDPDVIVVGELKDLVTTQLAIMAAETGHLVLATMNTVNAVQTISKLVESFPSEEQQIVRNLVSESLRGIICQQLVPKKDGTGMVCAYEVLFNNASVANLIRKGSFSQIENVMITGKASDMTLMTHSLMNLAMNGIISQEEAKQRVEQLESIKLSS